jgi:hypothetical protein
VDASGEHVLNYDHDGRLIMDSCTNGLLSGLAVSSYFHSLYGRYALSVLGASPGTVTHQYAYDAYGCLSGVGYGVYGVGYSYLPNSDRVRTLVAYSNSTPVMVSARRWDYGNFQGGLGGYQIDSSLDRRTIRVNLVPLQPLVVAGDGR